MDPRFCLEGGELRKMEKRKCILSLMQTRPSSLAPRWKRFRIVCPVHLLGFRLLGVLSYIMINEVSPKSHLKL
jgi:hypothetical protein